MSRSFLSPLPEVRLVRRFERGLDDAMAAARTCYSGKGIVTPEEVGGDGLPEEQAVERRSRRDRIAVDIYGAGHHTTFQHAHFQFALANVSPAVPLVVPARAPVLQLRAGLAALRRP